MAKKNKAKPKNTPRKRGNEKKEESLCFVHESREQVANVGQRFRKMELLFENELIH